MTIFNEIYNGLYSRLTNPSSKEEGSFSTDNIAAVAVELARIQEMRIDNMPNRFFPTLASGDDLTLAAKNFGVERKPATKATVQLTIKGEPGAEIKNVCAAAGEIIFTLNDGIVPESGEVTVWAVALAAGAAGNVLARTIDEFVASYPGLDEVINLKGALGGADEEGDEDLRLRVAVRWQKPSTGGNITDYERWALAVPGVSRARVLNPRAGEVLIYLIGAGNTEASQEIVRAVHNAVQSVRPVGANVTVYAAEALAVDISANVVLSSGYSAMGVINAVRAKLSGFLLNQAFATGIISYARIAEILFVDGVSDILSYTINGGTDSIPLANTQFGRTGEVNLHVMG